MKGIEFDRSTDVAAGQGGPAGILMSDLFETSLKL
jgi:hypothetical protein